MARPYNLTDRQVEILELLAQGRTTRQVCQQLYITPNTLKSQLYRISKRTGCSDRAGMVGLAYRSGVLRIPTLELMRQANELADRWRRDRAQVIREVSGSERGKAA